MIETYQWSCNWFRPNCHDSDWIRRKLCAEECKKVRLRSGIDRLRILYHSNIMNEQRKKKKMKVSFKKGKKKNSKAEGVHRTIFFFRRKTKSTGEIVFTDFPLFCFTPYITLIGWTIAFVRAIGAITRTVTPPPLWQAAVFVFASEFFISASSASEFVVSQTAILSSVTDPSLGNARVVVVATVLVGQTFTFRSCSQTFPFWFCGFTKKEEETCPGKQRKSNEKR